MSNKVFYQHPNLMRALGMHETVMEVMVNVLGGGDSKVLVLSSENFKTSFFLFLDTFMFILFDTDLASGQWTNHMHCS